jgi:biopolymer transport protein ExbB
MLHQAIEIFHKGGWIMWPLLVLAIAAIAVSVERTLAIRKAASDNDAFIDDLRKRLNAADFEGALQLCDQTPGPVPQLLASGIRTRHLDNASIERAMEELALRQTPLLHKRLGVLDTVITMAPLLGLLGTITA